MVKKTKETKNNKKKRFTLTQKKNKNKQRRQFTTESTKCNLVPKRFVDITNVQKERRKLKNKLARRYVWSLRRYKYPIPNIYRVLHKTIVNKSNVTIIDDQKYIKKIIIKK